MTSKQWITLAGALLATAAPAASRADGAVYTLSNDAAYNEVLAFRRGDHGELQSAGRFATGGRGSGAGLGSQGAIALSPDGSSLFAVDAGSDEITSFRVTERGLTAVSHASSGGQHPISLTVHDDLLYVLNDGGDGNIAGFRVEEDGVLVALPNSARPLSGTAVGPAEIAFTPGGDRLVVTEKNTNRLSVYFLGDREYAEGPVVSVANGITPFGFAFTPRGFAIVSEAFGGVQGAGAASSYRLAGDRASVVTGSAGENQTSPCWVAVTHDGRTAFVANTGSGTVSAFAIDQDGQLTLLESAAGSTGAGPADLGLSHGGQFLYVRDGGNGAISAFRVGPNGSLSELPGFAGLPPHAVGIAVR